VNRKPSRNIQVFIKQLKHPVFTTQQLCALSGKSASTVTQALNRLEKQGLILKVYRGIWAEAAGGQISPFSLVPFLLPRQRSYVSFITALHLYGIVEQIPQVITLASTSHTRKVRTKLGVFSIHHITPRFFSGFDWYQNKGDFLIAEPEKALVDSLYLSAYKKRQFGYFPELHFPRSFSFRKAREWTGRIPNKKVRTYVQRRLTEIVVGGTVRNDIIT